jgi:hypothetical protein
VKRVRSRSRGWPAGGAAAWQPTEIDGLVLWVRPEDLGDDESLVASWTDASGNGNHLSQASQPSQPIVTADALDGWKGVTSDGVDDFLSSPTLNLTQPSTVFAVFVKHFTTDSLEEVLWDGQASDARHFAAHHADEKSYVYAGAVLMETAARTTTGVEPFFWKVEYNSTSSIFRQHDRADTAGDAGTHALGALRLFAAFNATSPAVVTMVEVGVVNAAILGSEDEALLDSYVAARFPSLGL